MTAPRDPEEAFLDEHDLPNSPRWADYAASLIVLAGFAVLIWLAFS